MPPQLIRIATLTDVDALVQLMRQYYAETQRTLTEPLAARALELVLDDSRLGQAWMIEQDGRPAGFVVLTVSFSMEYGGLRGFVDNFFVAPAFRGRGLAHLALEEVKRSCVRRGVRALFVETRPEEGAAMAAYRSVGFLDSINRLLTLPLAPSVHEGES